MVTAPSDLASALGLQVRAVESTVEAGAQFQQMVNLECISDFTAHPDLSVSFSCNGTPHKLSLKVPITVNKFMEPTEMTGEAFFARWKNLSM
jgi:AP-2 complex subunit alpha